MLHPIDQEQTPPPVAYRVPWLLRRSDPSHPVIVNDSVESADFVRVFCDSRRPANTQLWGQILPSESIELCLCHVGLDEAVVAIAWFRPADGLEYLWRFIA